MKIRKLIAAFLSVVLIVCMFYGCGNDKNMDEKSNVTQGESSKDTTQANTEMSNKTEEDTTASSEDNTLTEESSESTQQQTPPSQFTNHPFADPPLVGALPESGSVDSSYFDDVVFVGDSVSLKLSYYEAAVDKLGAAQFLTSGSLGSGNALWKVSGDSVHPTYNGTKMRLDESIPLTGAKKLYIMLGTNDIALYGIDSAVANMVTLIQEIQSAVPDIAVYVQTMTPITSTSSILSDGGHNPQNIHRYNEALAEACQNYGWKLVNVAEAMYDEAGYLRTDYCSDPDGMGVHFTEAGCEAWISYLYTHTG